MNVKQGLFRLWIVASVLWVLVVGVLGWGEINRKFTILFPAKTVPILDQTFLVCGFDVPRADCERQIKAKKKERIDDAKEKLIVWFLLIFGVPVLVQVLGRTGVWITRGFREQEQSETD